MSVPRSNISWTDYSGGDANFVLRGRAAGDCEVSRGCANCYAGAILRRSGATGERTTWNEAKFRRFCHTDYLANDGPFRRGPGSRPMVFVCDMGDLFHDAIDQQNIVRALNLMEIRNDVDYQILTKRPRRMLEIAKWYGGWPANVWAGTTVEDQRAADERIPLLLQVPAKVRFLSMEPLLERVDLRRTCVPLLSVVWTGPEWIITGAESGPQRRPFDPDWARDARDICRMHGIAYFHKQGSDRFPGRDDELDGVTYKEFPA